MKLAITDLGERLLQFRKALDLHQKDLAEKIGLNQNQISRIENGLGGSLESVLEMINFYSEHFHLGPLVSDEFEVIRKSEVISQLSTHNSVAVEKLMIIQNDLGEVGEQISEIIGIIRKEAAM
jgi:transcriptional regulator with XRE-family HTH domain